ncbi:MAG: transporter substrate-binding domain-containing protein [Sedimenticola sp.]
MTMYKTLAAVCGLFLATACVNAGEITLIAEDAAPNSYIDNGQVTGKAVEVVQAVLKEIDMEGEPIRIYPWARGYKMLESRKNIALFPTSRTEQRETLFKWAGPIADNEVNLYKLKSRKDIQPETLDDLKKYRAGSAGGINNMKTQYLINQGFEVEIVDEDKQNIDKLFAGRVDFVPYASTRLSYDIKRYGHDPQEIEKIWNIEEMSSQAYMAFSKPTDDAIVEKFQKGFDAIKQSGEHDKILMKWK